MTAAATLVAASAAIPLVLGALHLLYTYSGEQLFPRDASLIAKMKEDSPRISRQTSVWRSSVGFHASHSLGAILYGSVYMYLALRAAPLLFSSLFLVAAGFAYTIAMTWLARQYWFSVPLGGMSAASLLYAAGIAASVG